MPNLNAPLRLPSPTPDPNSELLENLKSAVESGGLLLCGAIILIVVVAIVLLSKTRR